MRKKAEDIFNSFRLNEEHAKKYKTVMDKFDGYFVVRRNTIFEKARFNRQKQEVEETAKSFIAALHKLSIYCNYGVLRNELIHNRIIASIYNEKLSEKLQLDVNITLEKAITLVKQTEQVHQQQELLRGPVEAFLMENAVRSQLPLSTPVNGTTYLQTKTITSKPQM